jgi:hypothetical protein
MVGLTGWSLLCFEELKEEMAPWRSWDGRQQATRMKDKFQGDKGQPE